MQLFRNPVILLVLIVLAFLLFGANKLPKMARNMGQSMRILKSEVKEMKTEDSTTKQDNAQESESQDGTTPVEGTVIPNKSEEHTSELQSRFDLVCRLLLEKKKKTIIFYRLRRGIMDRA